MRRRLRWSVDQLRRLDWRHFEALCAAYFGAVGFRTQTARAEPDGVNTIRLYDEGPVAPSIVVRCEASDASPIDVEPVRGLLGIMQTRRVETGIFVTAGSYTAEAIRFAARQGITLIDGEDLERMIGSLLPEQARALQEITTSASA